MKKILSCTIILVVLSLFTILNAENYSRASKSNSTPNQEQLNQSKAVKTNPPDNNQAEKTEKSNYSRTDKEEPAQKVEKETSKPNREERSASVEARQSRPDKEQTVKHETSKPERVQSYQSTIVKPSEPEQPQDKPDNNYSPSRPNGIRNAHYNYSKPSQGDAERLPNLSGKPIQTDTGEPGQITSGSANSLGNVQPVHTTTGNPIQPAYRHNNDGNNNPPDENHDDHHDGNNHHNNHHNGGGGHYGYPGWYDQFPHNNWCGYGSHRGYYDCWNDGYWYPGLTIYINWQNEEDILTGYLVDNDWDVLDERSTDLRVGYNPFPFNDIHKHNADCPYGGYGILVKDDDGVYTFFHFDKKGNKLAAALLNKTYSQNKKIRIEITGDINRTKQSIKIWTLDKVSSVRKAYIGRYQIQGIDVDTSRYYFGSYNYLGRFHQRHHLWARF